jgi:outer membrane protein assembly factor BamB
MTKARLSLVAGLVLLAASGPHLGSAARAQEWTRFRGPNGQGISSATTIPAKWTEDDYNWKATLPGVGHSSPVVWGDTVFVTSGDQQAKVFYVLAFSALNGQELWRKEYPIAPFAMNPDNDYAAGTPCVDADHLYVALPTDRETRVMALGHDGSEVWAKQLPGVSSFHGPAISVVAVDGLVVFSLEQEGSRGADAAPSQWLALDANTGDVRWTCERTSKQVSYSTPCVYTPPDGPAQLIFSSQAHGVTGVEIETGKVLWEAGSVLPQRVVSSPVIAGDLLIATCGQGGGGVRLVAIRPGSGELVYEAHGPQAPYVPTPLAVDDLLFICHDRGDISCLVAATGEVLWSERPAGTFYASPVCADGRLFCTTRQGDVVVVRASRTYELLAVNPLGEATSATPAIAGGRMFLRTLSHLISIGGK